MLDTPGGGTMTVQVTDGPFSPIGKDLSVLMTHLILTNHDWTGGSTSNCAGSAEYAWENTGPIGAIANYEISHIGHLVHLLLDFLIIDGV